MKYLSICITLLIFLSCSNRTCPSSVENQKLFSKYMKIVRNGQHGEVLVEEFRKSINFLSLVTGIDSKAGYSNTFGYDNEEDYQNDMKEWKDWYKNNKCMLTDKYVDSVYKSVNLKRK